MQEFETLIEKLINYPIDRSNINSSYKELRDLYFELFSHHLSEIKKTELEVNKVLFRIRKNKIDLLFDSPDELFAPPPIKTTNFGRFNLIGTPLYYCSDSSAVSILESKPLKGEFITMIEHCLTKSVKLAVIGHCKRYNPIPELDKLNMFYTKMGQLTNKVVIDQIDYLPTATLGHVILSDRSFNGLMFPSIYSKATGDNFAIQVEGLGNSISFKKARVFQVIEKYSDFHICIRCIAKTETLSVSNNFLWEKVSNCDTHEIKFDENTLNDNH